MRVTISDANLILGRLPASRFGQAAEAAYAAMREQIAVPLGLSVEAAAERRRVEVAALWAELVAALDQA